MVEFKNTRRLMKNLERYREELKQKIDEIEKNDIELLMTYINDAAERGGTIYLCGNGGSLANSMHIANDLQYGSHGTEKKQIKAEAIGSNNAYISCIANDRGYKYIFSDQLDNKGEDRDLLVVLSGSGKSLNIIKAIESAKDKGMKTIGIIGYDGGECMDILEHTIHIRSHDMQVCEDMQLIIMHIVTQTMKKSRS